MGRIDKGENENMNMLAGTLGLWDFSVAWDRYIRGKVNICMCCLGLWDFDFTWDIYIYNMRSKNMYMWSGTLGL